MRLNSRLLLNKNSATPKKESAMDTTIVIIIAIFALVVVVAFLLFRQRAKASIKGPGGMGVEIDASNQPDQPVPGVKVKDAKSRGGGLVADDQTGRGADVERVEVQDDILVSSTPPGEGADPKE
jgi:hypothetical protein